MNLTIYKAKQEDALTVAKLAIQMWEDNTVQSLTADFEDLLESDKAACFIKYVGDRPVGFAQCQLRTDYVEGTETSPVGYLEGILVEEAYQHPFSLAHFWHSCSNCVAIP